MTQYWKTAGIALVVLLLLQGCKEGDNKADASRKPQERITYSINAEFPSRMSLFDSKEMDGNILAERSVDVVSKGTGECKKMLVEEGDIVKEGQVIAELDQEELEVQLLNSSLSVQQQKYQYDMLKAQSDDPLIGTASPFEVKNAKLAWDQAAASLKLQQVQLRHQKIKAPISGIITRKTIQKGMMVTAGAPVVTIVDPTSYYLPARIPEKDLGKLQNGQAAQVEVDSLGGDPIPATVRRIDHDIEGGFVTIIMDFDKEIRKQLREGAYVRVHLIVETHENALVVPKDAVLEEGGRQHVLVVRDEPPIVTDDDEAEVEAKPEEDAKTHKIAEKVYVDVGLEDSNYFEILSGITESDQIVTLGQRSLEPGSRVKVSSVEEELESRAEMTPEEALEKANQEREAQASASS